MSPTDQRRQTLILTPDEIGLIRRYIALSRDIIERYAREGENSQAVYQRLIAFEQRTKKTLDEILEEIERINRLLILDATGNRYSPEAKEIRAEIKQEQDSLQWQLSKQVRNLQYLQEQATGYGSRVPLDLVNEISDTQDRIHELESRLTK